MEFCPRCGKLLISNNWFDVLVCPKCGNEVTLMKKSKLGLNATGQPDESIIVMDREEVGSYVQPTVKAECPKCNGRRAYSRMIEVGEEGGTIEIQIFRCTNCGHNWRKRG